MTAAIPVAFYAPLKSPNHPAPSGDRTMAQLLLKALHAAGFAPELASELRSLDLSGDPKLQADLRAAAEAEADRIASAWRNRRDAPRLWFTYHNYFKAPDWIGPRVAGALGIPYVVAEGSRAGKRAGGPWALGHAGAEAGLDRADLLLAMTDTDREALERALRSGQALLALPPFTDADPPPDAPPPAEDGPPRLLAVAMMRPGDKLASYRILADALSRLAGRPWRLEIVGDGEARGEIEQAFRPLAGRIAFRGRLDGAALAAAYAGADLLVWPAVREAYGMVLLEAQAHGCPVAAGRDGGVASVVRHGETGLLSPAGDAAAFAGSVATLLDDRSLRLRLGAEARRFVREERGLAGAAERLRGALLPLLGA